ncbi:MAG: hypothetical protein WCB27_07605 [Thermoguttaceae bacterium]
MNSLPILAVKTHKDGDGYSPVPLELPKNARTINLADLKSEYRKMLSNLSIEEIRKQKDYVEKELRTLAREESDLSAKLARLSADGKTDKKTLEDIHSQLVFIRGEDARYAYHVAKFQQIMEARERLKISKPSRNKTSLRRSGKS